MKAKIFIILILLLNLSCVSTPKTKQPELDLEIPHNWLAGDISEGSDNSEWWLQFGDSTLDGLIEEMLEHNFDIQAAAARLDMAADQARIAGASLYAQLSTGLNGSRR